MVFPVGDIEVALFIERQARGNLELGLGRGTPVPRIAKFPGTCVDGHGPVVVYPADGVVVPHGDIYIALGIQSDPVHQGNFRFSRFHALGQGGVGEKRETQQQNQKGEYDFPMRTKIWKHWLFLNKKISGLTTSMEPQGIFGRRDSTCFLSGAPMGIIV